MSAKRGIFISFEGGEGSGKTTQIQLLKEYLEGKGHDVVLTREPGGTPEAEKIRSLLVEREGGEWSPMAECLLLFAARAMHARDLIEPALNAGKIVLTDRFTDSTRAYQGYAGGMDLGQIEQLKQLSIGTLEPDLTFILDIPAAAGLARSNTRQTAQNITEDRFEKKSLDFHEALRQGFLILARQNPTRCHVIDADNPIDAIATQIAYIMAQTNALNNSEALA